MASPICTVQDGGGAAQSTTNGANATPGNTVTIQLASTAGVKTWTIACIGTDETQVAATINAALVVDGVNKKATYTAPGAGTALLFLSTVVDNGGVVSTTTFGVFTLLNGQSVGAVGMTLERSAAFGWVSILNGAVRAALLGLTGTVTIAGQEYDTTVDPKGTASFVEPKHVQTTDATVTTIDSFSLASATAVSVSTLFTAIRSDSGAAGSWIVNAAFKNNAGTVTQVGTTSVTAIGADDGTWGGPSCDFSGTTVRLRVTGKAATTIQWTLIHTHLAVIP